MNSSIFGTAAQPSDPDTTSVSTLPRPASVRKIPIIVSQVPVQSRQLSNLEKLPLELKLIVLEHLPKSSLGNIRLACNLFKEAATPIIARDICVTFSLKSFQNLIGVSRSPALSPHVQCLDYQPCFLINYTSQETWEKYYRVHLRTLRPDLRFASDGGADPTDPNFPPQAEVDECFNAYRTHVDEQFYMTQKNIPLLRFAQSLPNLPNLKTIKVGSGLAFRANHQLSKENGLNLVYSNRAQDWTFKPLIEPLVIDKIGIQHLRIEGIHWTIFDPSLSPKFDCRTAIFSNLVTMSLLFDYKGEDHYDKAKSIQRQEVLGACVAAAQQLEHLNLRFKSLGLGSVVNERSQMLPVSWTLVARDTLWPRLKCLELDAVTCSAEHMSRFFKRHAKTLKSVALRKMWLEEDPEHWQMVFKSMQTHLTLDRLSLRCVWGGGSLTNGTVPHFIDMLDRVGAKLAESIAGSKAAFIEKTAKTKKEGNATSTFSRIPPGPGETEKLADLPDPLSHLVQYLTLQPRHKHH